MEKFDTEVQEKGTVAIIELQDGDFSEDLSPPSLFRTPTIGTKPDEGFADALK